jgi:hypothetical protein
MPKLLRQVASASFVTKVKELKEAGGGREVKKEEGAWKSGGGVVPVGLCPVDRSKYL